MSNPIWLVSHACSIWRSLNFQLYKILLGATGIQRSHWYHTVWLLSFVIPHGMWDFCSLQQENKHIKCSNLKTLNFFLKLRTCSESQMSHEYFLPQVLKFYMLHMLLSLSHGIPQGTILGLSSFHCLHKLTLDSVIARLNLCFHKHEDATSSDVEGNMNWTTWMT